MIQKNILVFCFELEITMLKYYFKLLYEFNPDITIGYNIF